MENSQFTEEMKSRFKEKILDVKEKNPVRLTFEIKAEALPELAECFYSEKGFRFIIASALQSKRGLEILYHFSNDKSGHVVNLQVVLPLDKPAVASLTSLLSGVEWIEREMHELYGIQFEGHPNLVPLFSAGNWPEGTYPYRKD